MKPHALSQWAILALCAAAVGGCSDPPSAPQQFQYGSRLQPPGHLLVCPVASDPEQELRVDVPTQGPSAAWLRPAKPSGAWEAQSSISWGNQGAQNATACALLATGKTNLMLLCPAQGTGLSSAATLDGGKTWHVNALAPPIAIDPKLGLRFAGSGGSKVYAIGPVKAGKFELLSSDTAGASWTRTVCDLPTSDVKQRNFDLKEAEGVLPDAAADGQNRVHLLLKAGQAGREGALLCSSADGLHFQGQFFEGSPYAIGTNTGMGNELYLVLGQESGITFVRSQDGGATWNKPVLAEPPNGTMAPSKTYGAKIIGTDRFLLLAGEYKDRDNPQVYISVASSGDLGDTWSDGFNRGIEHFSINDEPELRLCSGPKYVDQFCPGIHYAADYIRADVDPNAGREVAKVAKVAVPVAPRASLEERQRPWRLKCMLVWFVLLSITAMVIGPDRWLVGRLFALLRLSGQSFGEQVAGDMLQERFYNWLFWPTFLLNAVLSGLLGWGTALLLALLT